MQTLKTTYLATVIIIICWILGCSKSDKKEEDPIIGLWNVKNVSGGFTGIERNFEDGVLVWTFSDKTLVIENNDSSNLGVGGMIAGTYTYSILVKSGKSYVVINDRELGRITIESNEMIIDQNDLSVGNAADLYVIKLTR